MQFPERFFNVGAAEANMMSMDCGLAIPETLFSNDPDDIRHFYAAHRDAGVIFKLCIQTHWHEQATGARHALYTTELRAEDLRDDEALYHCPAIYQRKVEKAYELRVTCMDQGLCVPVWAAN